MLTMHVANRLWNAQSFHNQRRTNVRSHIMLKGNAILRSKDDGFNDNVPLDAIHGLTHLSIKCIDSK